MIRATYGRHRFPHKRIRHKVVEARKPHTCSSAYVAQPPEGCRRRIEAGDPYVRVAIMPSKRDPRDGWHHAQLCSRCAVAYELAKEGAPAFARPGLDDIADELLEELEEGASS